MSKCQLINFKWTVSHYVHIYLTRYLENSLILKIQIWCMFVDGKIQYFYFFTFDFWQPF